MKILVIHNKYFNYGGEESVVDSQINILRANGHAVITYFRSSEEISNMTFGNTKAFFSGLYNRTSIREIKNLILKEKPHIIHIHNLYPFISPSILPVIKRLGVPIVMNVHNYRLFCPNGLFFNKGAICEKCTSSTKEINCILNNCEGDIFKSTGYAIRNFWARNQKLFLSNVDFFISPSSFHMSKLIKEGLAFEKCYVIPNMYGEEIKPNFEYQEGSYVGYVGRLSKEKGSDIILKLAKELPDINFKIAGSNLTNVRSKNNLKNIEYVGFLGKDELDIFYSNSLFTLFTSICNESFGLTIIEAFAHKKPVIATDLGASPEIIENDKSGLIYQSKNLEDLANKVKYLYSNKKLIRTMGENGYRKLVKEYTSGIYYKKLLEIYELAHNSK